LTTDPLQQDFGLGRCRVTAKSMAGLHGCLVNTMTDLTYSSGCWLTYEENTVRAIARNSLDPHPACG
jgi:hypothetical protein